MRKGEVEVGFASSSERAPKPVVPDRIDRSLRTMVQRSRCYYSQPLNQVEATEDNGAQHTGPLDTRMTQT